MQQTQLDMPPVPAPTPNLEGPSRSGQSQHSSLSTTPQPELERFAVLEKRLEQISETASTIGQITCDFTPTSQNPLNGAIYSLVLGLQETNKVKNSFSDVKVPLEILEFLDDGKNPQMYTREVLERTVQKNKEVNGKIEIYKKFRAHLLKEFGEEMPDLAWKYRSLREDVNPM